MKRTHRLRWQAAAITTVAALTVAACSSNSSSSSSPGAGSSSSSSSAALTASAPGITPTQILIGSHQPLTGPAAPGYSEIAPASAAYFAQSEPSSPILLLIGQAQALVGRSFYEAMQVLLPEESPKARLRVGQEPAFVLLLERLGIATCGAWNVCCQRAGSFQELPLSLGDAGPTTQVRGHGLAGAVLLLLG